VTQGYTTEEKCSNWPLQRCTLQKQKVKKYSPETECKKVPFELCGPAGCPVEPGQEQCQDRKETVSGLFYVLDFLIQTDLYLSFLKKDYSFLKKIIFSIQIKQKKMSKFPFCLRFFVMFT
jgi:hypothetical protein